MENILEEINRLEDTEKCISDLRDRLIESIQSE